MKKIKNVSEKLLVLLFLLSISAFSSADLVTKWNNIALMLVTDAKLKTPHANRAMALVHTSIYVACNAISQRYPVADFEFTADTNASIDAAIASASRDMLLVTIPEFSASINKAYDDALSKVEDGTSKINGVEVGQRATKMVLKLRQVDPTSFIDTYKPRTSAGVYVPTTLPAVPYWRLRKPWFLSSPEQFRAPPPPALTSETWTNDFNEVKTIGDKNSKTRSQEQTNIAKFWQATLPPIYHGVIRSVAMQSGRDLTQNARLYATATRAIDDAIIAVFEGKYHFQFWRPITAIRNADIDGNPNTLLEAGWTPFIPTPMHPEYPCAHCVVASTLGTVLKAELGNKAAPTLTTNSITANNAQRSWASVDEFIQEVSDARIYDGVHYRFSAVEATKMGKNIGELAVKTYYLE